MKLCLGLDTAAFSRECRFAQLSYESQQDLVLCHDIDHNSGLSKQSQAKHMTQQVMLLLGNSLDEFES
jgi:hypothetical protein